MEDARPEVLGQSEVHVPPGMPPSSPLRVGSGHAASATSSRPATTDIPERLNKDAAKDGDAKKTMGKFLRREGHEGMEREEEEEGGNWNEA